MLKFTLPNICENKRINSFLIQLSRVHADYFKEEVSFIQESGAIPYCSWSGYNSNIGSGLTAYDFIHLSRNSRLPVRINFANILLEPYDFEDCMGQAILKAMHNGSNLIELSNLELLDHIVEQYPNYKFVLSKQVDFSTEMTPELLNLLIETDKFVLIGIPDKYISDIEFLSKLEHKSKFEITVNPPCPIHCRTYKNCGIQEHKTQLAYSGVPILWNCKKCNKHSNSKSYLSLKELKETYVKMGFSHFTFSPYYTSSVYELLDFYLTYFIKPEYYNEAYKFWYGGNY